MTTTLWTHSGWWPVKRARGAALSVAAVVACLLPGVPANASGSVARTFSAYDITQCSCTYNSLKTAAYVNSFPKVTASSYYDSTVTAMTSPYTRGVDVNLYHAYNGAGSLDGKPIWTSTSEVAYILCWTTASSGAYMDKVAAKLTVNDVYGLFIFYIPDRYITDWILESNHHC